jgi:isoleucyl-tRNA synthetase
LYTTAAASQARRSAQSALWHITQSVLTWMAPVLSFTAEEAWATFTGKGDDSVLLHTWYELPPQPGEAALVEKWNAIREARAWVQKELEEVRASGAIGSSLQAEVELAMHGTRHAALATLADDLRFVLITSQASLTRVDAADQEYVRVNASPHAKCGRCWHWRADVGRDAAHPELCGRCTANLFGAGEPRACA